MLPKTIIVSPQFLNSSEHTSPSPVFFSCLPILPTQWLHSELAGFGTSLTTHSLLLRHYHGIVYVWMCMCTRETHVPLKAPTGLRTGATSCSILCEVWNERLLCWRAAVWAGRANAALRSAEGMRAAIVVCVCGCLRL